jgi:2-dehydropantoate 2-reductase
MRIAVMGSGGIGGYLGARLSLTGEDVAFVARGAHLAAMRSHSLQVESPFGDVHLPTVTTTDDPAEIGPVDLVLFTVKLYDSETAAASLAPLIGPSSRVVTLQNGIDSIDILSRFISPDKVVGGAIYLAAMISRPGLISKPGGPRRVLVGGAGDPVVEALKAACDRAVGIDCTIVSDIWPELWDKFVTLCAFSGATALMRSGIGDILADIEARAFLQQLRDEGMAVAAASGYVIPEGFADRATALWERLPPETRSSMASDLANGKRLELEWLSGRMHALGQRHGVPTPAHTAIYRTLHLRAHGAP